ncbi:MAG: JAB domain-containing protein [Candidatus Viridilinea halotolerans]|uniref:JAB domain-containing protein n=1 Tax=Candidatus Viridilinea halotolerans TaxID=2491704 RepID=A0A426U8J6_9CHLR|nr:MAG: JAB domain-containing protein [Candidatus Viridilinea halotolerans]
MPRFIRELPPNEQPLYRLTNTGPASLSDAELIAVLTNLSDMQGAQRLLDHFGGLLGLFSADVHAIRRVTVGVGASKAAQIVAAFEVARRILRGQDRVQIRSPTDATALLRAHIGSELQEHLAVVCLDTKNRVIKIHTVYIGSVNSSAVRIGEIYREPIRLNATSIIVAHNHPSQDLTPSPEDVMVTRQIVDAGKLLDIECLDHLVIGMSSAVSLRERGSAGGFF